MLGLMVLISGFVNQPCTPQPPQVLQKRKVGILVDASSKKNSSNFYPSSNHHLINVMVKKWCLRILVTVVCLIALRNTWEEQWNLPGAPRSPDISTKILHDTIHVFLDRIICTVQLQNFCWEVKCCTNGWTVPLWQYLTHSTTLHITLWLCKLSTPDWDLMCLQSAHQVPIWGWDLLSPSGRGGARYHYGSEKGCTACQEPSLQVSVRIVITKTTTLCP